MNDCICAPAAMKLSVSFSEVLLRHVTVATFLMIVLDAVTCIVEVKLEFRGVPLTLVREAVKGAGFKSSGGISPATYEVV